MQHHEMAIMKHVKHVLGDFFAENKYNGMSASVQRGVLGLLPTQVVDERPQIGNVEKIDVKKLIESKAAENQPVVIDATALPKAPVAAAAAA